MNIKSLEQTQRIADDFSKFLFPGNIVLLNGNLGTGKTTFIKFICKNFNINNVNSPTFSIVNEYEGSRKVYHIDFYRLKSVNELYDIGFDEYLHNDAILFIEWAELFPDALPHKHFEVKIKLKEDDVRIFNIINNYE